MSKYEDSCQPNQADQPLFRPEALSYATKDVAGSIIAAVPLSWTVISVILALLFVAAICALSFGSYTRKETAAGIVRAVGGEVRIDAGQTGIVTHVFVSEGQRVRAKQTLLKIETNHSNMDGSSLAASLNNLDQEIDSLRERLSALNMGDAVEHAGNAAMSNASRGELAAAVAQEASALAKLQLAREAMQRLQAVLSNGFISGETIRRRTEEVLSLEQSVTDARGSQSRIQGQLDELRSAEARRPITLLQNRAQLNESISRLKRERQSYASQLGFLVKAPFDGVVSAVQVARGEGVTPTQALMTLSQAKGDLIAELFIASRAIGFVSLGQTVEVRYDAFPYQRFGSAKGKVVAISTTVLRPEEVRAAIIVQEPVYRVLVKLDTNYIRAYGTKQRIVPGLAFKANIVLDERSFAAWLLDPIIALKGQM